MIYEDISVNDRNFPITRRFSANSASTKKDGSLPYGMTIQNAVARAYDDQNNDVSAHLIAGTSVNGDLVKVFVNGSTEVQKATYAINLNITYASMAFTTKDCYVKLALIKIR